MYPLYESTPSAIRDRYFCVLATVEQNAVPDPLAEPPVILSRKDLVNQIVSGAYSSALAYPTIAATIHAVETVNQTSLAALTPFFVSSVANCSQAASTLAIPDNRYEGFSGVAYGESGADPQ